MARLKKHPITSRQRRSLARVAPLALGLLLATASSGCLDFTSQQNTVMSVDLYWDEQTASGDFSGGTCKSAGVSTISWTLTRADNGDEVASNKDMSKKCVNGIDFIDQPAAQYTLKITGQDANGDTLWNATCKGLAVLRFDVGYECDIDAP